MEISSVQPSQWHKYRSMDLPKCKGDHLACSSLSGAHRTMASVGWRALELGHMVCWSSLEHEAHGCTVGCEAPDSTRPEGTDTRTETHLAGRMEGTR
ncbi:hypothetical protein TIFTF001_009706 [Ficus carica]|uniref:Uncharacterized protein n=1 Tax=Ficus carica TaxID=3494 RepID=A0AA87ZWX5_FICCA|nr:hypothetical protein TIFTF001_009706 [Ficus carica]